MTDYDKRVNDEADEHAQKMQEQRKSKREGWDGKSPPKVFFASARMVWDRDAFTVTNKDNNQ